MKKVFLFLFWLANAQFLNAQIINTFAGVPLLYGWGADNIPATAANLYGAATLAVDKYNNIYISTEYAIRKVNTSGIITTIAGNHASTGGYGGDGGTATAALISFNRNMHRDAIGNIYIYDNGNARIRKIDTSGIITTIAGNGTWGFSPDGTVATAANIWGGGGACGTCCLTTDRHGNVYFSEGANDRIRKIDSAGILHTIAGNGTYLSSYCCDGYPATSISLAANGMMFDEHDNLFVNIYYWILKIDTNGFTHTIAGNGIVAHTGDGGLATAASIKGASLQLVKDGDGNFYFCEDGGSTVRKIDKHGIITTIAGSGIYGFAGDGGPATAARLRNPEGLVIDNAGNLYFCEYLNYIVRYFPLPDGPPVFTRGDVQNLLICQGNEVYYLDTMLAVADTDTDQTLVWSVARMPAHGVLVVNYSAPTTGGIVTPIGLSYTPVPGYIGNDTFKVRVTDGIKSDTTMVCILIVPLPYAGTITGPNNVCVGTVITLTDTVVGGRWQVATDTASVSATGVVTGLYTGTDMVYYIDSNVCGKDTASYLVTIHSTDGAIL